MQFNHTLSAIIRGKWLVDKQWADAHMPMVLSFMKGEAVDFGIKESREQDVTPTLFIKSAGRSGSIYNVSPYSDVSSLADGSFAMVTLAGPMMKRGGMCSYGMVDQAQLISRLANADNVDGIFLNIDSPGGQADGTALLSDVIKTASTKKPIIAVIDDGMAASAAMWIASAATEIYVTQLTDQVGSIGVYTQIADWNKYYKDFFKLEIQDIYAPQSVDKNKEYRDAINGDTNAVEESLAVLAEQFINTVAANRGARIKNDKWKTGKLFYAKDAQKIGLIDGIKSFDQVVQRMITLSNSNSNSSSNKNSNMAFKKTMTAAKAESFEVAEGGFLLQEEQLNNIETALTTAELNAAALETANATIGTLTAENATALEQANANVQTLTAENTALKTAATDAKTASETQAARIVALETEVAELGKGSSGTGTPLVETGEEHANDENPKSGLADPDHPVNQYAASQIAAKKRKKI